jgi:uncharacterized protein YbjT (DUF2867 family)
MSVIVTGAAGHLGRLVAEQLLERLAPEHVVLVTRRPQALRELGARGADVRYGDFDDPASLRDAFAGGRRMLLISTDAMGRRVRQHRAAIDAAAAAGVGHVVFTSHVKPVAGNPIGAIAREPGETEARLHRSGLAWTVLRFGSFAELQLAPAAVAAMNRRLVTNMGDGRIVPVSRRDCAEAAAVSSWPPSEHGAVDASPPGSRIRAGSGRHLVPPLERRFGPDVAESLGRSGDEPDLRILRHGGAPLVAEISARRRRRAAIGHALLLDRVVCPWRRDLMLSETCGARPEAPSNIEESQCGRFSAHWPAEHSPSPCPHRPPTRLVRRAWISRCGPNGITSMVMTGMTGTGITTVIGITTATMTTMTTTVF